MSLLAMMTFLTRSAPMVMASSPTSASITSNLYDIVSINMSSEFCVTQTYTAYVRAQCPLICERSPLCHDVIICNTTSSTVTCHTLVEGRTCSMTTFDATKCRRFSKQARNIQSPVNATDDLEVLLPITEPTETLSWLTSGAATIPSSTCPEIYDSSNPFKDCYDAQTRGVAVSCMRIVTIQPQNYNEAFRVRCYGGQTLIQQRSPMLCDLAFFNRSWSEYASGFGEPDSCFWLGNDKIWALSNQAEYDLQLKARSSLGEWQTTLYTFKIDAAENQYKINVASHVGNNSDRLLCKEGSSFYTYDESHGTNNTCAIIGGGWWYGDDCDCGNLNDLRGPRWLNDQGSLTFYNESTMAITPTNIPTS